jgi:UDP-N-acetylmuramoyl-tripeptide--D-alanyl-D-alanine ligase
MNTPIGISRFMTTLEGHEEVLIFEMGEYYPGDIKRLSNMTLPDMGVITGINEQHLVRFKTLDRTVATIYELADYLDKKPLWVNGESELAKTAAAANHRVYSRSGVGEWKVSKAKTGLDGTQFTATKGNVTVNAKSALLGLHQVGPLVAAIDIATHLGLAPEQIEAGIAATRPFEHRMQPATAGDVVTIDDSYNGNPDGARVAIEFLAGLKGHRRIYVTPGFSETGSKSAEVHRQTGKQLAEAGIEVVALVKNSVTPHIAEGLEEADFKGELIWYPDGMSSLVALPKLTVAGDVVLLQNDWGDQYA